MTQPRILLYRCNSCGANYTAQEWNFKRGKCKECTANKFSARKVRDDGYIFDSKAEHRRYCELRWLLIGKKITGLEVHPKYEITVNAVPIIRYTADFRYVVVETGEEVVEDVKSAITRKKRDYQITKKLMWAVHHIKIVEIM